MNPSSPIRRITASRRWAVAAAITLVLASALGAVAGLDGPIIDPEEPPILPPPSAFDECGFTVDTQAYLDEVDLLENGWQRPVPLAGATWRWVAVKFHLLADSGGSFVLSEAQVQQAIDDLNGHFAPARTVFYLGTDIDYLTGITTTENLHQVNADPDMIDVYTVPFLTVAGLAPGVGSGGRYLYVRSLSTLNGSTLSHEMGHVFGLYHTHTCVGECECPSGSNCATSGDLVCDTPADPGLSGHVYSTCVYDPYASPPAACDATPYDPDTHNLMSYSYTQCRDHFTPGQVDRMDWYRSQYLASLPTDAPARTAYVDAAAGSDDNPGTADLPFATIAWAAGELVSGSTVLVLPGTYAGAVDVDAKALWIASTAGPALTTITGLDSENLVTFTNVPQEGSGLEGFTLSGGWMGVWCRNSGPVVRHCVFAGQHIDNWAACVLSGTGYGSPGPSPATIVNNTIRDCTNGGLSNFSTAAPTIRNNIITGNKYGIHQDGGAAQPDHDYNDVWANPEPPYLQPPYEAQNYLGAISAGPHSLSLDPLLDGTGRLMFGSPCVDAGDPAAVYNDPDGSRNDLGAIPGPVYPAPVHVYAGQSIKAAVDTALSGQDILVHAGAWTESIRYAGKTLRVVAVDGPGQTFLTAGNWGYAVQITDGEGPGTEFAGFTVTSPYGFIDDIQVGVGASAVIRDCVFTGKPASSGNGQHVNCGGSSGGDVLITRNLFHDTAADNGVYVHGGTDNVVIANNTFSAGVRGVTSEAAGTVFVNNIVAGHGVHGISGTFATADYNDVWNNTVDYGGGLAAGAHDLSADPLFVDPAGGDYGIGALSPCRDAGDPAPAYNDPDGSRNDIGAYPWVGIIRIPVPVLMQAEIAPVPALVLEKARPNPFNPSTEIWFSLRTPGQVVLRIHDLQGRLVRTLVDGPRGAGRQMVRWDGTTDAGLRAGSGVYLYRLQAAGQVLAGKMTMLK